MMAFGLVPEEATLVSALRAWTPQPDDRVGPLLKAEAVRTDAEWWTYDDCENVIAFLLSLLTAAPQPPVPQTGANAALGRFGHHPDPAIDFELEVTEIESITESKRIGLAGPKHATDQAGLERRIELAMLFQVGGDPSCCAAKARLCALATAAPQPPVVGEDAEVEKLRTALIAMGRMIPGVILDDRVSTDFLTRLPDEMGHYHLHRAALATQPADERMREGCVGSMTPERATYFLERFKRDEKMLGPHEQWALDFAIAALKEPRDDR